MTGFLVASLLPPQAELEIIAVDARVQRRGLARKLFDELVCKLGLAGVTRGRSGGARIEPGGARILPGHWDLSKPGAVRATTLILEEDAVLMRLELK